MGASRLWLTLAPGAGAGAGAGASLASAVQATELTLSPSPAVRCLTPAMPQRGVPEYPAREWKQGTPAHRARCPRCTTGGHGRRLAPAFVGLCRQASVRAAIPAAGVEAGTPGPPAGADEVHRARPVPRGDGYLAPSRRGFRPCRPELGSQVPHAVPQRRARNRRVVASAPHGQQLQLRLPRDISLKQFVGAIRGIETQRVLFDFNTMNCPFNVRLTYLQPYLPNNVREIEAREPARQPFLDWLSMASLKLTDRHLDAVFGDGVVLAVPCGKIELGPPSAPLPSLPQEKS